MGAGSVGGSGGRVLPAADRTGRGSPHTLQVGGQVRSRQETAGRREAGAECSVEKV